MLGDRLKELRLNNGLKQSDLLKNLIYLLLDIVNMKMIKEYLIMNY